jgi:hypothetical protein
MVTSNSFLGITQLAKCSLLNDSIYAKCPIIKFHNCDEFGNIEYNKNIGNSA